MTMNKVDELTDATEVRITLSWPHASVSSS